MLSVVMGLEEGKAQVELEHDASNAPHVTGLRPAQLWKEEKKRKGLDDDDDETDSQNAHIQCGPH